MREDPGGKKRGPARRALKWIAIALLSLLGLAVALIALLQIAPVREAILDYALVRITAGLPGELTVADARWPGLGHFELAGVSWVSDGREVARADTVSVSVRLLPLIRKDVRAEHILAHGLSLDVPGIRSLLGSGAASTGPEYEPGGFPRPGVIPGIPSVSVDSVSFEATSIQLSGQRGVYDLVLTGGFDFSAGGSGKMRIGNLRASGPENGWKVHDLSLDIDPGAGSLSGEGSGALVEGYPIALAVESTAPDEFTITLARERGYAPPEDPGVLAKIRFERDQGRVTGIDFDVALRTPTTDEIGAAHAMVMQFESLATAEGIRARAYGTARLRPTLDVAAHLEVREPARLERGMVALRYNKEVITVDSLALRLPQGVVMSTAAEVRTGEEIRIHLESIMIEAPGDAPYRWKPSDQKTGTILYRPGTGSFSIERLTVTGDYGEMNLDGNLDGTKSGEFTLAAAWPEPPAFLYAYLGDGPGLADSLRAAWAGDAPYSVTARVNLSSVGSGREIGAEASMRLPGPRGLGPLFPGRADVADLGPAQGDMSLTVTTGDAPASFDLDLDLSETAWMDTSVFHISGRGDSVAVDEFLVSAAPLRLSLTGDFDRAARSGRAGVAFSDSGFLRHFSPAIPDMDLHAEAEYARSPDGPGRDEIHATLSGSIVGAAYAAPGVAAALDRDAGGLRAWVRLPEGLLTPHARLDSVEASFVSAGASDIFPATITLVATGEKYRLRQRAELDIGDTIDCAVDTLKIEAYGNDLAASGPFRVRFERETGTLWIDKMDLAGSLGQVTADGFAGPGGVNLKCDVALDFPPDPPPGLPIPPGAWPSRLDASLDAPEANVVNVNMKVQGFQLDDGSSAEVGFALSGTETGVTSTITLDDGTRRLVDGNISLPAAVTVYPPGLAYHHGDVSVDLTLDGYPLMVRRRMTTRKQSGSLVARLDGEVNVSGPFEQPAAYLGAEVSFPDWPDLAGFVMIIEGAARPDSIRNADRAGRADDLRSRVAGALGLERPERLVMHFVMRRGQSNLLEADLSYPVSFAFNPFHLTVGEGRLDAKVKAEALPLEDIDVFMPKDVGLDGTCRIDLAASGPAEDPAVSGTLGMTDFAVKYRQILDLLLGGNIEVRGTARQPKFVGELSIHSGFVNLPQRSRDLHPVEGRSILLDTAWRAALDTASVAAPERVPPGPAAPEKRAFEADYDITLDIAHGFWLRGEGLEVQLDGKLEVTQQHNLPVPVGDLTASRGTFLFLGRVFNLDRGTISFYGEEKINPSLDLTLRSAIENYQLFVRLRGTLEKPEIELTSDPDLPEGDIVAMILFGKPLESLDEGQGDMLKDRTADILIMMGASRLQQSFAGQGGIDVVSVRSARGGGDQGAALVVGKYITPDLLVTYEQALKEKSTSYIVMEYMLNRYVKLETLYSNQSKTGIGVGVEKDY